MIAILIYGRSLIDGVIAFRWGILMSLEIVRQTDNALPLGGYPQALLMVLEERLHLTVAEIATVLLQSEHTSLRLRNGDTHATAQSHEHRPIVQTVDGLYLIVANKRSPTTWQQSGLFALLPNDDTMRGGHPQFAIGSLLDIIDRPDIDTLLASYL